MPVITKITQQKKDSERYNIFLDEKYAFSVHETVLVKFGLTKGMPLKTGPLTKWFMKTKLVKHLIVHFIILGFRMRSEFEVKTKLIEAGYGEAVVLEAIVKLRNLGFLK